MEGTTVLPPPAFYVPMVSEEKVKEKAQELRIDQIGFSAIEKTSYDKTVRERIARGFISDELIEVTESFRQPEIYADAAESLPGAKTLICVGSAYLENRKQPSDMSLRGAIARHVWRDSYKDLADKRDAMIEFLKEQGHRASRAKVHPREAAMETGLAWIGRNAFAINPTYGSWALYYALVTDARFEPMPRINLSCPKNCRKCMDACPTKAIVEPYVLNASRCLNYVMEEKGVIPEEFRSLMGNRINGCDKCQEVCPMNKKAKPSAQPRTARATDPELVPWPRLDRLFEVTNEEMDRNFAHMDWLESTLRYLRRNALIAVGNSGEKELLKVASEFSDSDDTLLREHARWATEKLKGS